MVHNYVTKTKKMLNQFNLTFMRVCTNKEKKEIMVEDEREMRDVIVDVSFQEGERIVTLVFMDCNDERYLHLKKSIEQVKQDNPFDYEQRDNSYMFHLEFDSEKEISCGGDLCTTKSKCYVDETNNAIVFIGA